MRKSFAVIGLGRFGMSIAKTLVDANQEVMVVDCNEERIKEISDDVTYALEADIRDGGVLESLGLSNMDVVIVAIAEQMDASILATVFAKDAGVPYVVAKAISDIHGEILTRVGADRVVYPERSMGIRVAKDMMFGGFLDLLELSPFFSVVEILIPEKWIGKSLVELRLRDRLNVNVIGIKAGNEVNVNLDPNEPFKEGQIAIIVGNNEDLQKIFSVNK